MIKCSIPKQNLLCIEATALVIWLSAKLETERRVGKFTQTMRLKAMAKQRANRRLNEKTTNRITLF